ncbi:MAG: Holliday junction branch migration protein RuvA [Planctomycetota bacterium]|nr:Holliday junction branch migration protein RuvA [Planctomycetota bacterium]
MYDFLEGRVARSGPARLVLDVGGVGYDLAVPLGADFQSGGERGERTVRVWTHLVVREDAHSLYGFPDRSTREWFRLLLGVRGVGPGVALGLLSGLTVEKLSETILRADVRPLVATKGVGQKTAEQILLDLRDKVPQAIAGDVLTPAPHVLPAAMSDAVAALMSIGYSDKQARRSVEHATKSVEDPSDLELLVRTALKE